MHVDEILRKPLQNIENFFSLQQSRSKHVLLLTTPRQNYK